MERNSGSKIWWFVGGCMLLFICLGCLTVLGLSGVVYYGQQAVAQIEATETALAAQLTSEWQPTVATPLAQLPPTATATPPPTLTLSPNPIDTPTDPPPPTETPIPDPLAALNPPPEIMQLPLEPASTGHLLNLLQSDYPARDYFENAVRLAGVRGDRTVSSGPYQIGDRRTFFTDLEDLEAELLAVSEHAYFWADVRLNFNNLEMDLIARQFDSDFYPTLVDLFGQEWQPGIDNDPRFSVLHLDTMGETNELGYFDSGDEYPRTINSSSNELEMIYLNMNRMELGEDLYFGTLSHEVQHLIQWNADSNETAWLNEGLSQLAEIYLGLDTVDTYYDYLDNPAIQLNSWEYDDEELVFAHYGGAFLFSTYFWEQLGDEAVRALARHPANGMSAVYAVLQQYRPSQTLLDFFADWSVATYIDDSDSGSAYHYASLNLQRPKHTIEVSAPPYEVVNRLNQFGVHYVELKASGPLNVTFVGDTQRPLTDGPPPSGRQMWLAPAVDDFNARLTAGFDLSELNQATLNFSAWYDLEDDYDFAYVTISTDGGFNWRLLVPNHSYPGEFGPGFNGRSLDEADQVNGWVEESISLNSYAGQNVLIRFELLTDSAILSRGFALDDINIPELDYSTDVEGGSDGWQAEGFVQTGWAIPQQWGLHLIQPGTTPRVTRLELNSSNRGQWPLQLGPEGGILVVTGLAPLTDEMASYWLAIE